MCVCVLRVECCVCIFVREREEKERNITREDKIEDEQEKTPRVLVISR